MPNYLIKHTLPDGEERYLCWSTIVDAPLTYGVTREQIRTFWLERWGQRGLEDLDRRLAAGGDPETLAYVQPTNRAGADETRLTIAQIVDYYIVRQGTGPQPRGADTWGT